MFSFKSCLLVSFWILTSQQPQTLFQIPYFRRHQDEQRTIIISQAKIACSMSEYPACSVHGSARVYVSPWLRLLSGILLLWFLCFRFCPHMFLTGPLQASSSLDITAIVHWALKTSYLSSHIHTCVTDLCLWSDESPLCVFCCRCIHCCRYCFHTSHPEGLRVSCRH